MFSLLISLLILLLTSTSINAQPAPACPPSVLLSLARAGSACYNIANHQACFGGGMVSTDIYVDGIALTQPGDRAEVDGLQRISVARIPDEISMAMLNIQADLPDAAEKHVFVLAFGTATLENLVSPTPRQILTALGTVNIRVLPALQTEIVARINIGQTLIGNGITADRQWLRVTIPNTDDLGWVSTDVMSSEGDINALSIVTPETILHRAFEILTIETDVDFSICDGTLPAGVLIQTPNVEQPVTLTLNNLDFKLSGTALVQGTLAATQIAILEGEAIINQVYVPAGASFNSGSVTPIETVSAGLPLNNLARRFELPIALTVENIAELTAAYQARVDAVEMVITLAPDTTCRRTTRSETTLWAGPGNFYEAINELPAERVIHPVLATADPDGEIWWQLRDSNWVRARLIVEAGECDPVQISDRFIPPRNNTLSLETCRTTNGPLRAGQSVRIEFRPPAFDNYGEARDAVSIDPGRIIIGADRFRASATEPIRLGTVDDRYIRTFYVEWKAVSGTFRIEGDRLTYEPICSITVPVG